MTSAATIALPTNGNLFEVVGTTDITNLSGIWSGRRFTLMFGGALTAHNGNAIVLSNGTDFTTRNGSLLEMLCYGASGSTFCHEVARSI